MKKSIIPLLFCLVLFYACNTEKKDEDKLLIKVSNHLDFDRKEVISINAKKLSSKFKEEDLANLHVKDTTGQVLRHQWIDYNEDGKPDEFLFQATVGANGETDYTIVLDSMATMPEKDAIAYSRFVPERTDDYTWENDKVAFRTYGPTGQKEALEGVPGSTLSSGIDLWLKRTEKPVINKWYAEHVKNPGYYHIDHGEGYDPYHVGASRGTGGIGIFENDSLYVSQNFTNYKTIASGPLKTIFELTYAPWGPYNVKETKRISLALGAHFSKFEVSLKAADSIPTNYAIGITLHENKGTHEVDKDKAWAMHWESIDDSMVGEGIVINPSVLDSVFARVSNIADQSNILMLVEPKGTLTYYAGFAWKKSGDVTTEEDWKEMLQKQAKIIAKPLNIKIE